MDFLNEIIQKWNELQDTQKKIHALDSNVPVGQIIIYC